MTPDVYIVKATLQKKYFMVKVLQNFRTIGIEMQSPRAILGLRLVNEVVLYVEFSRTLALGLFSPVVLQD